MEKMNGGYIMLDMTTADAARVQAAYESGKVVIMFDGDSVQPATVTKSGSTYTVTGTKSAYTVTADSKTKTNAAYDVYNYITETGVKNMFMPTVEDVVPAQSGDFGLTVNADKTITTTGTKTSAQFITIGTFTPAKTGIYMLSCGIDTDIDTHAVYIKIGSVYYWARKDGLRIPMTAGTEYTVTLKIAANYTNNETYKIMIRDSRIDNADYAAYTPTNAQLYAALNALETRVAALETAAAAAVSTRSKK